MTRIDFYLARPPGDRLLLTCRLAEKAYAQGHRVYVHCADPQQADHLDRLLWSFRQGSFIPHALAAEAHPELDTLVLGADLPPEGSDDVLINLGVEVPAFFSRFERLAEPLDTTPEIQQAGRRRYAFYRDRGYPLAFHEV